MIVPVETLCVATGQSGAEIGADMAPTLNCNHEAPYVVAGVVPFDTTQITSAANYSNPKAGDPCHPLAAQAHVPCIAFKSGQSEAAGGIFVTEEYAPTLQAANNGSTAVTAIAFTTEQTPKFNPDCALTLTKQSPTGGGQIQSVMASMQVRRLTPNECESLQGFPQDYTAITHRGKPAADGPRYKALGNSWAVPNVQWIGRRIDAVSEIIKAQKVAA